MVEGNLGRLDKVRDVFAQKNLGKYLGFWVHDVSCRSRLSSSLDIDARHVAPTKTSFSFLFSKIKYEARKMVSQQLVRESFDAIIYHYKAGSINWPMVVYITLAHVAAIVGIFTIPHCQPLTLLWAFILWPISGIGITGGVHRLWAHRAYKASFPLRVYLMLSNSIANQGSIWHWSRDHRCHHKHSEVYLIL